MTEGGFRDPLSAVRDRLVEEGGSRFRVLVWLRRLLTLFAVATGLLWFVTGGLALIHLFIFGAPE